MVNTLEGRRVASILCGEQLRGAAVTRGTQGLKGRELSYGSGVPGGRSAHRLSIYPAKRFGIVPWGHSPPTPPQTRWPLPPLMASLASLPSVGMQA